VEISKETLTKSIHGLSDDALLKRWAAQLFTDEAMPIAAEEIRMRGLDTSPEALARVSLQDSEDARQYRKDQLSKVGRGCLYLVVLAASIFVGSIIKLVLFR